MNEYTVAAGISVLLVAALDRVLKTRLLAGKRFRLDGLLARVSVRWVEGEELVSADEAGRSFVNLNTPDDLARFLGGRA